MAIISGGKIIEGVYRGYSAAGAPANGTNEVQTITITGTPTGGTFKLKFEGYETAAIAYNAAAAAVQAALEALPNIDSGDVTAGGGALPGVAVTITFGGNLARKLVNTMTVVDSALTGGTTPAVAVAKTTPGVDATGRGAPKGAMLTREDTGVAYINTGTALAPTWVTVGSQT